MESDKEKFVNAMMKEYETNPEKITQFALRALDEMQAYNDGQKHAYQNMLAILNQAPEIIMTQDQAPE